MKQSRADREAQDRAKLGIDVVQASIVRHHGMTRIEHAFDQLVELDVRLGELRHESALRHARTVLPRALQDMPDQLLRVSPYPLLAEDNRKEREALQEVRSYERGLLLHRGADVDLCEPYAEPEPVSPAMQRRRAFNAAHGRVR